MATTKHTSVDYSEHLSVALSMISSKKCYNLFCAFNSQAMEYCPCWQVGLSLRLLFRYNMWYCRLNDADSGRTLCTLGGGIWIVSVGCFSCVIWSQ